MRKGGIMIDYLFSWAITMFQLVSIGVAGYLVFAAIILIGGLVLMSIVAPFISWLETSKELSTEEQHELDKYNLYKTN